VRLSRDSRPITAPAADIPSPNLSPSSSPASSRISSPRKQASMSFDEATVIEKIPEIIFTDEVESRNDKLISEHSKSIGEIRAAQLNYTQRIEVCELKCDRYELQRY